MKYTQYITLCLSISIVAVQAYDTQRTNLKKNQSNLSQKNLEKKSNTTTPIAYDKNERTQQDTSDDQTCFGC